MDFGIRVPPCDRVSAVVDCISRAEELGFASAWIPDSPLLWRDTLAVLILAAERTERITLATCVTNTSVRHPVVLAAAATTIAELAPGRVMLGLGAGGSALRHLGRRAIGNRQLREDLTMVRALMAGETVAMGEEQGRLWAPVGTVPLLLSATGPRNLALAGELADGVILPAGLRTDQVVEALSRVASGRDAETRPFSRVATVYAGIGDPDELARGLAPILAWSASSPAGRARLGAISDMVGDTSAIAGTVYPDMNHAEDWDAAVELAGAAIDAAAVRRFAETSALVGSRDHLVAGIECLHDQGIDTVIVRRPTSYELPWDLMESFAEVFMPGGGA